MERYEALILIQENLDSIVDYLHQLKAKIEPEFRRKGFSVFDVGVDVVETATRGSIDYTIKVYGEHNCALSAHEVSEAVKTADPNYKGRVGVICGATPYPVESVLNLQLLEDMKRAKS